MFRYDEKLGWRFLPNRTGPVDAIGGGRPVITTNEAGFRDKPFGPDLNKKKIAVFGDSFVSNVSMKAADVFTEIMEKKLPGSSVMNFGVNGYGQVQEYLLFEEVLKTYKPDFAVFVIYLANDFFDNVDPQGWAPGQKRPYAAVENGNVILRPGSEGSPLPFSWRLELPHFILEKLRTLRWRMKQPVPAGERPWDFEDMNILNQNPPADIRNQYQIMEALILKIAARAQEAGTRVLFVLAPSSFQISEAGWREFLKQSRHAQDYDVALPDRRLVEFAKKNSLPVLDLYPRLRYEFLRGVTAYDPEELHWNAAGNRITADEILKNLPSSDAPQ